VAGADSGAERGHRLPVAPSSAVRARPDPGHCLAGPRSGTPAGSWAGLRRAARSHARFLPHLPIYCQFWHLRGTGCCV